MHIAYTINMKYESTYNSLVYESDKYIWDMQAEWETYFLVRYD